MQLNEIIFDENLEMYISPKELNNEVCLSLSDSLLASEEILTDEYKGRIVNFINNLSDWYNTVVEVILKRAKQIYDIDAKSDDLQLMKIFVLFEQNEDELYGLGFRIEFDVEHGCGIKIKGNSYEIVEIGTSDVAFA